MKIESKHCYGLEKPEQKAEKRDDDFESKVCCGQNGYRATGASMQITSNKKQKENEQLNFYWKMMNERNCDGKHHGCARDSCLLKLKHDCARGNNNTRLGAATLVIPPQRMMKRRSATECIRNILQLPSVVIFCFRNNPMVAVCDVPWIQENNQIVSKSTIKIEFVSTIPKSGNSAFCLPSSQGLYLLGT